MRTIENGRDGDDRERPLIIATRGPVVFDVLEVRGRDVQTGSPGAVEITVGEVYPIVENIVRRIATTVKDTLTELRPEVAADIYDRGVILTGGGALLDGIEQSLANLGPFGESME